MQIIYSMAKTCAIIGTDLKADERLLKPQISDILEALIRSHGITHFISDLLPGAGICAAECVLELRGKYPELTIEAAIPYEEQHAAWSESVRSRYFDAAARCTSERFISRRYTEGWRRERDKYFLENSSVVLRIYQDEEQIDYGMFDQAGKTGQEIFSYCWEDGGLILHKGLDD